MKRALSLVLTAVFALSIVGCHASIEPNDTTDGDTHYKKTTTYDNGTKTTKTETKVEHNNY